MYSPDHNREFAPRAGSPGGSRLLLSIGGVSGTGKSTLAHALARQLDVPHLLNTDQIRRALRTVVSARAEPALHCESFDVPWNEPNADTGRCNLAGFEQQCSRILDAAAAMLEQSIVEHWSAAIEGVHLVPGELGRRLAPHRQHTFVEVLFVTQDAAVHRAHFERRGTLTGGLRAASHYLDNFDRIRELQRHLVATAERAGTTVIDTSATGATDRVLAAISAARRAQ